MRHEVSPPMSCSGKSKAVPTACGPQSPRFQVAGQSGLGPKPGSTSLHFEIGTALGDRRRNRNRRGVPLTTWRDCFCVRQSNFIKMPPPVDSPFPLVSCAWTDSCIYPPSFQTWLKKLCRRPRGRRPVWTLNRRLLMTIFLYLLNQTTQQIRTTGRKYADPNIQGFVCCLCAASD